MTGGEGTPGIEGACGYPGVGVAMGFHETGDGAGAFSGDAAGTAAGLGRAWDAAPEFACADRSADEFMMRV